MKVLDHVVQDTDKHAMPGFVCARVLCSHSFSDVQHPITVFLAVPAC